MVIMQDKQQTAAADEQLIETKFIPEEKEHTIKRFFLLRSRISCSLS